MLSSWSLVVVVAIGVAGYLVALSLKLRHKGATRDVADDPAFRNRVARYVLNSAIWGLIILASFIIVVPAWTNRPIRPEAKEIFNALLPVFGTWVGTLLAFYFSKENFEAASKAVADLAKTVSGADRLQSVAVKDVMIKTNQIETLPNDYIGKKVKDDNKDILLSKLVEHLKTPGVNKDRLPLFKDKQGTYQKTGAAVGVVHLSTIQGFISNKDLHPADRRAEDLTLDDLITAKYYKSVFENSFGSVPEDATLGRAKTAMDNLSQKIDKEIKAGCYDVFVTKTGDGKEPVLGWITNYFITEEAWV